MKKFLWIKEMQFINELIKNENNVTADYLKNVFSRQEYRVLLNNCLKVLKANPNAFVLAYRSGLFNLNGIERKITNIIDDKKLAPGIVIDYGTLLNQETILYKNKQEVIEKDGILIDQPLSMNHNTLFDLASTSKLFTAIAILQLVQLGLLDLEAPISEYVSCFPNIANVSLYDLLTFNIPIKTNERIDEARSFHEAENILFSIHTYNNDQPYIYTDMGCLVLKYIIEKITGIPLREYIESFILKPCQMNNTFLNVPDSHINDVANENYASYVDNDGRIITMNNITPGKVHDAKANALGHDNGNASGHAGWFSNTDDMSKLAQGLLNNTLLKEEYLLMLGQNSQIDNPQTKTEEPQWKSHHGILTFTKQPNPNFLRVQPFLSGRAFISPGFAGTTFCLDPLNKIYAFSAANRLHNRIFRIPEKYKDNILELETGEKVYYDGIIQKTVSMSYAKESQQIIQSVMELALQIRLLEKVVSDKKQFKLVREL